MFNNMFEEIGDPTPAAQQAEEALGRAESGFVGLDNQGATCYLNALLQAIYMTPELRHGLYAVDPKDLGGDKYEAEREQDRENEKARLAKERARLKKHQKEGRMQPDPEIVKGLLEMFSENGARRAALKTNNKGFEAALEWALQHSEDKDFEDPLPGYDDDDDDGAGANGTQGEGAGAEDGSGASGKKKKGKSAKMIPLELQRLFARLQLLDSRTVSTEDLTERGFKWKNDEGRMQHDAHELIRLLIDRLERDMRNSKVNAKLVSALYEGDLANQVKCLACGHLSERLEKYRDLLLQVQGQEDLVTSLLSYTRPERLSGDNKYFCDNCQEKQDALRSQTLRALPPVLIFSLNRFEFDFETLERVKVKQAFKYPLTLDMEPFVEGRAWVGNDNSDESQVPELAGDLEVPGTCRNRQKWVPQAWKDAEQEGGKMQSAPPLASNDQRRAARFDDAAKVEDGPASRDRGGGGGGGSGKGGEGLVYDLLAVVVHRGSAYSGHYHALIRDCLQEGRWLPPSGLTPSPPADVEEGGAGQEERTGKDGDADADADGPVGSGSGSGSDVGFQPAGAPKEKQLAPMELLLRIFNDENPPKHPELGLPYMQLTTLREATRARLDGRRWDKVYGSSNRLVSFIKDNADTFLLQSNAEEVGKAEVFLLNSDGGGGDVKGGGTGNAGSGSRSPSARESDPELEEVLRLSLEQAKQSGISFPSAGQAGTDLAPANGTASADGTDGPSSEAVPAGVADAIASEKHGRWFSFDDRKVTPISIRDLQRPFSGAETAYLLIYRSRSLDQEVATPLSTADVAAAVNANMASAAAAAASNSSGSSRVLPGGLHMTSVPPSYWMDKVDHENYSLKMAKDSKEADLHGLKLRVWLPKLLQPQMPHLVPYDPASSTLQQLPEELRGPLVLHMDDRETVKDLKREVVKRLGNRGKDMGVPNLGRVRLSELATHGPGLFLSRHIPDQPDEEDKPLQSTRQNRRRGGKGGGGSGSGRQGAEDESPVLGDLGWDLEEEPSLLVWDGERVGGVEVLQPSPETRPVRLMVSVLKAPEDVDRSEWIDGVLEEAGTLGPRADPWGPRAQTSQCWKEVYATAGATAAEMVEIVSRLEPAEVSPSKMCISLLRAHEAPADFRGTGRRRASASGQGPCSASLVQVEAVQIAGPSGVFEEWKSAKPSGAGGKPGGSGGLGSVGLELSEGSELLVEEQGAVSKLIATEFSSFAEMEVARRNRLVRVEVEVDELLVDTLRGQGGLPLAHDVAVTVHSNEPVTLKLECDAQATSIPHLKALCLLDLVPSLDKIPSSEITAILPPPPPAATAAASSAPTPAKDDLALVSLVKTVRLENRKSGNTVDESSAGANLFAAKIADGTPLLLEWGAPPATGKALVKFSVRVGNSTATARDPARSGTTYGPLEVIADLKEPVSALKARMIERAAESGFVAVDDKERRIRVESLFGDSNTLVEELKEVEPEDKDAAAGTNTGIAAVGKGKGKRDNNTKGKGKGKGKGGESLADGGVAEEAGADGGPADAEGEGGDGAAGKSKKKKKKKGGAGGVKGKGAGAEKDRATEEGSNSAAAAALAAGTGASASATAPSDEGVAIGEGSALPPFQDRLVEESGILGGQEIFLEDGRVPRPREIEVTVLAYAPHFLGLAAAAATEKLKLKNKALSDAAANNNNDNANGSVSTSDAKEDTAAAAAAKTARQKRSARRLARERAAAREGGVSVPTGLSVRSVWPDEEAERKKTDVDKHRADPVRLLSLQRQLSLRTLGSFHIDERRSLTELRSILRELLSEGLRKATKASIAEAARAAQEAAEAAAAAAQEALTSTAALGDADVLADDEIENIRNMVMMKNKNPKSRKKRGGQGRGAAAAKPPPPPPPPPPADAPKATEAANGHHSDSGGTPDSAAAADASTTALPPSGEPRQEAEEEGEGEETTSKVDGREAVKEVKTDLADSDDEIPLPEGVPGFEALEEAMLVRELTKDRLPGKIVRSSDGSGNTAGGLFVAQPISELHLSSSVALVLCLRPRLPQTPLVVEAHMSRREKLAAEIIENGQATKADGEDSEDDWVAKEPTLEEQAKHLAEAQLHLEALESNLEDLVKKREFDTQAYELGFQNCSKALKSARSEEQKKSVAKWKEELAIRKERIDNTQHTEGEGIGRRLFPGMRLVEVADFSRLLLQKVETIRKEPKTSIFGRCWTDERGGEEALTPRPRCLPPGANRHHRSRAAAAVHCTIFEARRTACTITYRRSTAAFRACRTTDGIDLRRRAALAVYCWSRSVDAALSGACRAACAFKRRRAAAGGDRSGDLAFFFGYSIFAATLGTCRAACALMRRRAAAAGGGRYGDPTICSAGALANRDVWETINATQRATMEEGGGEQQQGSVEEYKGMPQEEPVAVWVERPLKKEVEAMKAGVEKLKKKLKTEQDSAKASAVETASIFTRVKGVIFSGAKLVGLGKADDTAEDNNINGSGSSSNSEAASGQSKLGKGKGKDTGDAKEKEADVAADEDWGIPAKAKSCSKSTSKGGQGKGVSTMKPASGTAAATAPPTPAEGAPPPTGPGAGPPATAAAALPPAEATQADIQRQKHDEVERRRTDPMTDLHLWTFRRKNPLGDGGALPIDDPTWPGPLREVIVENVSQPTLDNLNEALGKAYGIPANRVWAIKHNWSKHEWVRFTREMGIKKASKSKKSKGKRLVTNLREAPYSLKDGDVVAVVDKIEDEFAQADLTRADDEAYREHVKGKGKGKGQAKAKNRKKPAAKRAVPEVGLTLGGWDDGKDSEESEESDNSDDDMGDLF
eukprot:g7034.t3